jgi:hypothetical protein
MASVTQICNRALIRLGASTITDITENSKEARLCNIIYDQVRQELLRSHPWNFAIRRATLASDTEYPPFEFSYQYSLPSDCLRVLSMVDSAENYKLENNKILTNEAIVDILYIGDVEDPTQFDSLFNTLLVLRIAMELSYNITGATFVYSAIQSEFNQVRREAKLYDAQEGTPLDFGDGDWLGSR